MAGRQGSRARVFIVQRWAGTSTAFCFRVRLRHAAGALAGILA